MENIIGNNVVNIDGELKEIKKSIEFKISFMHTYENELKKHKPISLNKISLEAPISLNEISVEPMILLDEISRNTTLQGSLLFW